MKPVLMITPVGASVFPPSEWMKRIANRSAQKLDQGDLDKLEQLKREASRQLDGLLGRPEAVKRLSAELNGMYGWAETVNRPVTEQWTHYLLQSDTAVGAAAAAVIERYLRQIGQQVQVVEVPGLSVGNATAFTRGMTNLLCKLEDDGGLSDWVSRGDVIFNVTAGFKVLQVYLGVLSMVYRVPSVYVFEADSEPFLVPPLPITIDWERLAENPSLAGLMARLDYVTRENSSLALASSDLSLVTEDLRALIEVVENEAALTAWGELVWRRHQTDILAKVELPEFPGLQYANTFRQAVGKVLQREQRAQLLADLAKVSVLWGQGRGTTPLKEDGGLRYSAMVGQTRDHFRVGLSQRVMCRVSADGGSLVLLDYGSHDEVER
jgi:putative CRISPR-associated protein (TIGR02619 family)